MRILIGLSVFAWIAVAASCAKSPRESPTRAPEPSVETLSDVATGAPLAVDVPNNPGPGSAPSAPAPPDEDDRGRGRLPSSRVDGGGSPKPLPPGVMLDASPL
jgi:hypothetical protein